MIAIIPALNEAETIGKLVKDLRFMGADVIVIDDGSDDRTGVIAQTAGASIVWHATPHNIGPSIIEGLRLAMRDGSCKRFAVMDAGGSHDPRDLPGLLAKDADIVIGSRFCNGAQYIGNPRRALFSKLAALMCRLAKPKAKLTDWTSGYRVYSRRAVGELIYKPYNASGHAWQIEILTAALRNRLTVAEAPITYTAGRSSLRMKSVEQAFMAWLELLFS